MKSTLIIITGGHATPAVACINELQSRGYNDLMYIGQKKSLLMDKNPSSEYRLITETLKIPFYPIIAGKLSLFFSWHSLIWIARMPIGFIQAFMLLLRKKPAMVLTFGSHVGVPVVYAAHLLNIPVVAHEQTVTLGRSNKFIQKYADVVCYSWKNSLGEHEKNTEKYVFTGNPIRKQILSSDGYKFRFSNNAKKVVFITGGNQGAHALNEYIFKNIISLTEKYNVIHQTGSNTIYNDFEIASNIAKDINTNGTVYIPVSYIFVEEMAEAYKKAAVVVSRGGANAVTELLALKKKSMIIPLLTSSGNEQFLNGTLLENLGLAKVVKQEELPLIDFVKTLKECERLEIVNNEELSSISAAHKNAERRIADIIDKVLQNS